MTAQALGSRYVLEDRIGQGSMGVVWRGRDRATGTLHAIKLLRPELAADSEAVARFVRERAALVRFRHRNVVTLHDMIVEGDQLALVMDLVPGGDLAAFRRQAGGPLEPAVAAGLAAQVSAGLAAAHAARIVHRDLKPANILLDGDQVKLADLGIARIVGDAPVTASRSVVGTAAYLAPEVIGGQEPTAAADVYAVGIMLYEMLAGEPPPHGRLEAVPAPPAGVPEGLWELVSGCLSTYPAARPTASDLVHALNDPEILRGGAAGRAPGAGADAASPAAMAAWEAAVAAFPAAGAADAGSRASGAPGLGAAANELAGLAPAEPAIVVPDDMAASFAAAYSAGPAVPPAPVPPGPVPSAMTAELPVTAADRGGAGRPSAEALTVGGGPGRRAGRPGSLAAGRRGGRRGSRGGNGRRSRGRIAAAAAVAAIAVVAALVGVARLGAGHATAAGNSGPAARASADARSQASAPAASPAVRSPAAKVVTAWQCGPAEAATLFEGDGATGQTLQACIRADHGHLDLRGILRGVQSTWAEQVVLVLKDPGQQDHGKFTSGICTTSVCSFTVTASPGRGRWTVIPQWNRYNGDYQSTGHEPGFVSI